MSEQRCNDVEVGWEDQAIALLKAMPSAQEWTMATTQMYSAVLSRLGESASKRVIEQAVFTDEWRPAPARLVKIAEEIASDGRPGVEQAWAIASRCTDEDATLVWTSEMAQAAGAARVLLQDGDKVAARMAFKEAYTFLLTSAREQGRPVEWEISLGYDKALWHDAVRQAVSSGLIPSWRASALLPGFECEEPPRRMLPGDGLSNVREIVRQLREEVA